jgi:hypothetical protein
MQMSAMPFFILVAVNHRYSAHTSEEITVQIGDRKCNSLY